MRVAHLQKLGKKQDTPNLSITRLEQLTPSLDSKGSPFFFAGQPVHRPHYTVFRRHGQPNELISNHCPPLIGYLHYSYVTGARLDQFEPRPDPSGRLNFIGATIRNKRVAQITPKEWTEDPYFVCILLALAQLQERKLELPKPSTYTVCLLFLN